MITLARVDLPEPALGAGRSVVLVGLELFQDSPQLFDERVQLICRRRVQDGEVDGPVTVSKLLREP